MKTDMKTKGTKAITSAGGVSPPGGGNVVNGGMFDNPKDLGSLDDFLRIPTAVHVCAERGRRSG